MVRAFFVYASDLRFCAADPSFRPSRQAEVEWTYSGWETSSAASDPPDLQPTGRECFNLRGPTGARLNMAVR